MLASELNLLRNLRKVSRYSILAGILASLVFVNLGTFPLELQVVLALIALTIGIPHGAVDHIVTVPKFASLKMAIFLTGYLGVVALAVLFILSENTIGFQAVVVMSAIHFGIGDAAFISEIDKRSETKRSFPKYTYAFAAGFTPVLIPLVNLQSAEALERVNPNLVSWVGGLAPIYFSAMVALAFGAILVMLVAGRWQESLDLGLLLTLSLVAPPLVAFAFYFGLWHALRHTGRLTLELGSAKRQHEKGKSFGAFSKAFGSGAPALILVLGGTLVLGLSMGFEFGQDFLWYLLVVIWALTVPHMALTARLDFGALRA